jgi:AcrR family transcriptional regulator
VATASLERRTQQQRRSRSEDALLDAAAELVAERGVDRASLAAIGDRAGVSRGLPTHHFGTKDEFVERLAQRAQDRIEQAIKTIASERRAPTNSALTGLDQAIVAAGVYLEMFRDPGPYQRALLVMWGSTFPSAANVAGMTDAQRRGYDGFAGVIQRGQQDGSIRTDIDPRATAVLMFGTIRGVAGLMLTDPAAVDMTKVQATCRTLVRAALRPTQSVTSPTGRTFAD